MNHPRAALAATLLALVATLGLSATAHAEPRVEYQLQAAYVSKFLRFVEWPEENLPTDRYRIGVVGNAEFREAMSALNGYKTGGRTVELRFIDDASAVDQFHVLVLGPTSSAARTLEILRAASDHPILTVSEAADFLDAGGIVQFVVVDEAMRFKVSVLAAERVELSVSSRLLRLAIEVLRSDS